MIKKSIKRNIDALKHLRDTKAGKAPNNIIAKINKVVDLFEQRRIVQRATAENLINSISTNNAKKRARALEEYENKIEQYEASQPAGERMANRASKAREGKQSKHVRVRLREKTKASAVSRVIKVAKSLGIGDRKLYSIKFLLYSLEP